VIRITLETATRAQRLAAQNGHEVGPFNREGPFFVARCKHCGAVLRARDTRFGQPDIHGATCQARCPDPERLDLSP